MMRVGGVTPSNVMVPAMAKVLSGRYIDCTPNPITSSTATVS